MFPPPPPPPPQQHSVNGYRGILPGNLRTNNNDDDDGKVAENDQDRGSARTRAFQSGGFRKRKLLQSTNLHKISKKAARPWCVFAPAFFNNLHIYPDDWIIIKPFRFCSNTKCGCRWPIHPCLLCTGRQDPTAPRDLPDMLSKQERIALLDPCFHPILSFPEGKFATRNCVARCQFNNDFPNYPFYRFRWVAWHSFWRNSTATGMASKNGAQLIEIGY